MGCFESRPEYAAYAEKNTQPMTGQQTAHVPSQAIPSSNTQAVGITSSPQRPIVMVTERDKAMLKLKSHRDQLEASLKRCDMMIKLDDKQIKECIVHRREDYAKLLIRRKKLARQREERAVASLHNIEGMIDSIETQDQTIVFNEALKQGTESLKSFNEILTVDIVSDTVEKFQDQIAYVKEVQGILQAATDVEVDPAEMERELELAKASLGEEPERKATEDALAHEDDGEIIAALASSEPTPAVLPSVSGERAAANAAEAQASRLAPSAKAKPARALVGA